MTKPLTKEQLAEMRRRSLLTRCRMRGWHEWEEKIDPKSGGFIKCSDCGFQVDCEDPDGDLV